MVDDPEQVTETLKSIETAEELTGGKFPDRDDEKIKKALAPTPNYKLHDSDDEEDDTGDSTLETRRSVRWAENQLKQRWFINARERREFNAKVNKGLIRGEVLDFKNNDDHDISSSAKEIE